MPAMSNSSAKKHKRAGSVVSCKDSNSNDGHCLHIWAADHMMADCHVISKQIDNMRSQWEANLQNFNKRQKTNNKQPKQGGNLHVLIDDFNNSKAQLEK
jgi:hypothetical protein